MVGGDFPGQMMILKRRARIEGCHFEAAFTGAVLLEASQPADVVLISSTLVLVKGQSINIGEKQPTGLQMQMKMQKNNFSGNGTVQVGNVDEIESEVVANEFGNVVWELIEPVKWAWRNNRGSQFLKGLLPNCSKPDITGCRPRSRCENTKLGVHCSNKKYSLVALFA